MVYLSSGTSCPPNMHKSPSFCGAPVNAPDGLIIEENPGKARCLAADEPWEQVRCELSWGRIGDLAFGGDFDGDGLGDLVRWRHSEARFFLVVSGGACPRGTESDGQQCRLQLGSPGVEPKPGDYDGDGVSDLAVRDRHTGVRRISGGGRDFAGAWELVPDAGDQGGTASADSAASAKSRYDPLEARSRMRRDLGVDTIPEDPIVGRCLRRLANYRSVVQGIWRKGSGSFEHPVLRHAANDLLYRILSDMLPSDYVLTGASGYPVFPADVSADYDGDGQADLAVLTDLSLVPDGTSWKLLVVVPSTGACPPHLAQNVHGGLSICATVLADFEDDDRPIIATDDPPVYVGNALEAWCNDTD